MSFMAFLRVSVICFVILRDSVIRFVILRVKLLIVSTFEISARVTMFPS